MYKVFFKDRVIYLGDNFPESFHQKKGLFYKYCNQAELKELVYAFCEMNGISKLRIFHPDMEELTEAFKGCFTCIDAGGGVVLNARGEFLAIKRNGFWDLPKGKLERGEDFETAAVREVVEETGLEGTESLHLLVSTFHIYKLSGELVLKETRWFEMRYKGTEEASLQGEEGITSSRWVKPGKAGFMKKNTYKSILDVLKVRGLV
ncbi:MAG: NUDIX domain-containing protein [Bacteroidota bacterium]